MHLLLTTKGKGKGTSKGKDKEGKGREGMMALRQEQPEAGVRGIRLPCG